MMNKEQVKAFLRDESGDTNFISIIIILGIVIVLAGIFIGFKDKIIGVVKDTINNFSDLGDNASNVVNENAPK